MATITKIEIEGFKAFPNYFPLDLPEGKNLLMYGENGSGKSSIYYALHVLLQSVFKSDNGTKYFTPTDEENLINIFRIGEVITNTFAPSIKLTFDNGDIWNLNINGVSAATNVDNIKLLNRHAIFINHSYVSRFHAARNSEEIDLWHVFYKDILPFYLPPNKSQFLADTYEDILRQSQNKPRLVPNGRYQGKIRGFNADLEGLINRINGKVSNIYNTHFKNADENDLDIKLLYLADNDPNNTNHGEYYLFYGNNRFGRQISKQLLNPNIGISIKENNKEIYKPQTYFNEAKLTAIALSVRFACLSQHPIDGAFLALDDMLISLDMSNRMKVIDYLLKEVVGKYKIYLFTHDRLFYSTLKKRIEIEKKRGDWLLGGLFMHNVDENNNFAPCVPFPIFIEDKEDELSANEYLAMHDYPACGLVLRKWCEKTLGNLYPDTYKKDVDSRTHQTAVLKLNDWITKLSQYCEKEGLDFQEYKNLKIYKDNILNSVSHYDVESPIYKEEILQIMKVLKKLDKIIQDRVYIQVNHGIGLELVKQDSTPITICINIRGSKNLQILNIDGDYRLSYFIKCSVKKVIDNGVYIDLPEEKPYDSIYDVYNEYCTNLVIPNTDHLLDVLQDHGTTLRDMLTAQLAV